MVRDSPIRSGGDAGAAGGAPSTTKAASGDRTLEDVVVMGRIEIARQSARAFNSLVFCRMNGAL